MAYLPHLLTLGACARGTVVILCVCVCVCLSVCLSVTMKSATYLVYTRKQGVIDFFMVFQGFSSVACAENALFKSSDIICRSPPPSLLPNDLSMDKRDSNNFFSMQRVCMSSQIAPIIRPTHHSLELINYQASWLSALQNQDPTRVSSRGNHFWGELPPPPPLDETLPTIT